MMMLVTYDIDTCSKGGNGRLQHVAKVCEKYGQRVQDSVFEMLIDPRQLEALKKELLREIDVELDNIRFYRLGKNYAPRISILGNAAPCITNEALIV